MSLSNTSTRSSWPGSSVRITWWIIPPTDQWEICPSASSVSVNNLVAVIYLIHLVPGGVKITLNNLASKRLASNVDLYIRVTFAFHHATHQVVFRDKILAGQEVDSEETLGGRVRAGGVR